MIGFLIIVALVGAAVGYGIGDSKGRGAQGAVLGLVLGFIGWLIVGLMEPTDVVRRRRAAELANAIGTPQARSQGPTRSCPWCAETIKAAARICRFCNRDVEPTPSVADKSPTTVEQRAWFRELAVECYIDPDDIAKLMTMFTATRRGSETVSAIQMVAAEGWTGNDARNRIAAIVKT